MLKVFAVLFLSVVPQVAASQSAAPATANPGPSAEQRAAQAKARQDQLTNDWANLAYYHAANAALTKPVEVVFLGDSITENWAKSPDVFFPGKAYVSRGVNGQTTPQMLVRFRQDVVALRPKVVVINGGTADISGNTGPSTLEMIEDNLQSMTEIAKANGIRVVLSSVTPAYDYPWKRGIAPAEKIVALNTWMRDYCSKGGCIYADYFTAMADEKHGMRDGLSVDGVHPTEAGYKIMEPIAAQAIAAALKR